MQETMFTVNREKLEVEASRVFKATPERLWRALTEAEQIPQWWGPGVLNTTIEKNEIKVGGAWRFVQTSPDGTVHTFRGIYKEIEKPKRLVRTFEYEPMAGHILIESIKLEVISSGSTKMTANSHYENLLDLEGMVMMGMEGGLREGFDRLSRLVEE